MEDKAPSWGEMAAENESARAQARSPSHSPTLLQNVRVFDGHQIGPPRSIAFRDGVIVPFASASASGFTSHDCSGKFLIPGLFDSHCHPESIADLSAMARLGITTGMSMAGLSKAHNASLQGHVGLTDMHVTGVPAASPENPSVKFIGNWPMDETLSQPPEAEAWVQRQLDKGAEYVKILADVPGLDQDTVNALVEESKKREKLVVIHAAKVEAVRQALKAGAYQIHHSPMDEVLSEEDIALYTKVQSVNCPTLVMMQNFDRAFNSPAMDSKKSIQNVRLLYNAGVTILAGSDATQSKNTPAKIKMPFGIGLHEELQLLVGASLSSVEALRAATIVPAQLFNLQDRGVVAPGYRADLVLLSEDPTLDIAATRKVEKVWVAGVEVAAK